jgi:hypothetical protein
MSVAVAVVIPLYNKAAHIVRAVESVLRQTLPDFALLVVDDGSTDDGAQRVAALHDPRITLLRTPHRGPGAARNAGIRSAESEWVALLDADDQWRPQFLEKTLAGATATPGIVAAITDIHVDGVRARPRRRASGRIDDYHAARMRFGIAMSSSSILVQRATFLAMGGFREDYRYAEDVEAWFRLSCEGPVFHVAEPLADIELHDAQSITRAASSVERVAGLERLLATYEAYRQAGRIPPQHLRSCRQFMEQQRARLALHLYHAGQRRASARVLLTSVPLRRHTWREYARCAFLALSGR